MELLVIAIIIGAVVTIINVLITKSIIKNNNATAFEQMKINQERINELEVSSDLFSHSLHDLMDKYTDLLNDYSGMDEEVKQQIQAVEEKIKLQGSDATSTNNALVVTGSPVKDNVADTIEALVLEKNELIKKVDQVRTDLELIPNIADPIKKREVKHKLSLAMKMLQQEIAEYQKREKKILENIIP